MATHTITAFFDHQSHADQAVVMLKQAGIAAADITLLPPATESGTYDSVDEKGKGFWASLEDLFGGTEDHATYAEGLRRGGTMVSVRASDADVDRAIAILEQHGSVDLDERETQWRSEGWTAETPLMQDRATTSGLSGVMGLGAAASGMATAGAVSPAVTAYDDRRDATLTSAVVEPGLVSTPVETVAETRTSTLTPAAVAAPVRSGADDMVQIVEERLDVGKRAVSRGKVRIHTSVVEKAVSENISLHSETLSVDRHAVDRPVELSSLDLDPFKERVIEMEEIDEEAVVAKSARVVEEIGLRKDAADRVETIRDTVRSTKVDIEDGRTLAATGLTAYENLIRDDMDVVGSDGGHVGTVDHLDGSKIKLKKNDTLSGGQHHFVPMDWIKSVEGKVMLQIPAAEAMNRWSDVA